MKKEPYLWDYIAIVADVKFPLKTVTIKGEIRFGEHPNKRGHDICLKIDLSTFGGDDKHEVVRYDDKIIEMLFPFDVEKFGGEASPILIYTRDYEREIGRRFPETHTVCEKCNHACLFDDRPEIRQELLTTYAEIYEHCPSCSKVRKQEEYVDPSIARRSELISNLTDEISTAVSVLTMEYEDDPELVPLLMDFAQKNLSNENCVLGTLFILERIPEYQLKNYKEMIDKFLHAIEHRSQSRLELAENVRARMDE